MIYHKKIDHTIVTFIWIWTKIFTNNGIRWTTLIYVFYFELHGFAEHPFWWIWIWLEPKHLQVERTRALKQLVKRSKKTTWIGTFSMFTYLCHCMMFETMNLKINISFRNLWRMVSNPNWKAKQSTVNHYWLHCIRSEHACFSILIASLKKRLHLKCERCITRHINWNTETAN